MGNLIAWLFTDPTTEGANAGLTGPTPINFTPWLILVALGFLVPIYYHQEGRKRMPFIKGNGMRKYFLDRMMNQLVPWAMVGAAVLFFRWALTSSFFSWRIWHVAWVAWGVGIVFYWVYYFIRVYPGHKFAYEKQTERSKFLPNANRRRTASARR